MLIDTHTHLTFPGLFETVDAVLERAFANGVTKFVIPGVDGESTASAIALMAKYPGVIFACAGLHPVDDGRKTPFEELVAFAKTPGIVAIGECGLDRFHLPYDSEEQEKSFIQQIELANTLQLPVIIHTRDAFAETMAILDAHPIQHGFVVHCFSGNASEMEEVLSRGGHISLTGLVTYPKNRYLSEMIRQIPLDRLMLETDSPYLAPQSRRGKVCEPYDIKEIAQYIAGVYDISLEEFAKATTNTANAFFKLGL